jgi:hypothetical protein
MLTDLPPNLQWYRAALLIVIALCTYLHIPLVSGGRLLVPSFPTIALSPFLFLIVWRNVSLDDAIFLLKIIFVLMLSIALSPGYVHISEKILSLVQCCLALAVTVMIVRLMQQLRRELLERALLVLWCLIIAGSVLELAGVIRGASDAFREWAYEGTYTLYRGDYRDMNYVGWLRPKLFSTEPSHVTTMFIATINSWLLIRVTRLKIAIVAGATAVMLLIMGSPSLVISAAITVAILVWNRRTSMRNRLAMILAALLIGALLVAYFGESTFSTLETRINRIGGQTTGDQWRPTSENLRLVYPYLTLADTWSRWPLFGVGFGGKEVVMEHNIFSGVDPKFAIGTNAAAEFGIYLGLVGGIWFIWLLLKKASQTGIKRLGLMIVIGVLMSQLQGGMESFRYWGFIALLWGALAVADIEATTDAVGVHK